MTPWEIIECAPSHVTAMSRSLRAGDAQEIQATGLEARKALWASYRAAQYRKAFIVGGQLAAIGGCASKSLLSDVGAPWLMTSSAVERAPITFVREGRHQIEAMLQRWPILRNYVDSRYGRAIGFLKLLGFDIRPKEEGILVGAEKVPFLLFELRR